MKIQIASDLHLEFLSVAEVLEVAERISKNTTADVLILAGDIMITISEPRDILTCNVIKGLRTLINSNDENTINRLSYPGTIEVITTNRLNIQEQIYLEYLGWSVLEDNKTWQYRLDS